LAKSTVIFLHAWLKIHPTSSGPLFPSSRGGRLSRNGLSKMWERREAGRPHDMRRLAITQVLEKTGDPMRTQRFSRHASIEMVMKYDTRGASDFGELAELATDSTSDDE
jgi:integrase